MKKITLAFVFSGAFSMLMAQSDGLPSNPVPGKCYVKCVTHDEFKTETVKVMTKPSYKTISTVPATYKWVTDKVLIKEATKRLVYHPAEYKWETVGYVKKEDRKSLKANVATFTKSSDRIEIFPKTSAWEYSTYSECKSPNPEDCKTLCFIEKPAQFTSVPKQLLGNDAKVTETPIAELKSSYKKQVVSKQPYMEEVVIAAKYSTIKRQVINQPAKFTEKVIPAQYKTVSKKVLAKKGGVTTWEEIDCGLVQPNTLDILWDVNSAKLTTQSKAKVDDVLIPILQGNSKINLELSSHTDSRGSNSFNLDLSQRRADAIKSYLVSKGFASSRIISKGMGETRLLNNCSNGVNCSSSQHQINRRTEYKVINQK